MLNIKVFEFRNNCTCAFHSKILLNLYPLILDFYNISKNYRWRNSTFFCLNSKCGRNLSQNGIILWTKRPTWIRNILKRFRLKKVCWIGWIFRRLMSSFPLWRIRFTMPSDWKWGWIGWRFRWSNSISSSRYTSLPKLSIGRSVTRSFLSVTR